MRVLSVRPSPECSQPSPCPLGSPRVPAPRLAPTLWLQDLQGIGGLWQEGEGVQPPYTPWMWPWQHPWVPAPTLGHTCPIPGTEAMRGGRWGSGQGAW